MQHQNVEESDYAGVMDGIGDRVRGIRETKRLSQQQLADAVTREGYKIGQSGIGNIESGRTKNPKCIPELAAVLGVAVSWLRTGRGEKTGPADTLSPPSRNGTANYVSYPPRVGTELNIPHLDHQKEVPLRSQMPKDLPVLGTVSGGSGGVFMGDAAIDYVRRHPALVGRTDVFGLYVEDVSMQFAFNPGDLVLVEGKPPRNGDHVVVEFKEGPHAEHRAILKKLKGMTPTILKLEQYNPPKTIEIKRDHVIRMRRVLTMMDLFGV